MIPAVILAGGASRRMGGGVKPLLPVGSKRLSDLVLDRLRPQTDVIAINANGGDFSEFDVPVFADSMPDFPGPLAGILAALDWALAHGFSDVITVAGDTPFFPTDLVARLAQARGQAPCSMAATQEGDRLFSHSVFGLWATDLAPSLQDALRDGVRKVLHWSEPQGCVLVPFDNATDPFFNVNTPQDLATASKRLTVS